MDTFVLGWTDHCEKKKKICLGDSQEGTIHKCSLKAKAKVSHLGEATNRYQIYPKERHGLVPNYCLKIVEIEMVIEKR